MTDQNQTQPPFALFIHGEQQFIFDLSDQLGFESEMFALAVSVFEDGKDTSHVQALYASQAEAEAAMKALKLDDSVEAFVTQLPDTDWVSLSQAGLPPVEAGPFWIHGDHDANNIPPGTPHPIMINAGLAFGTGHHGTTKGCLLIFDQLLKDGLTPDRVLDLGCGAGILAIAAAKALSRNVLATDIDPDAVAVCRDNAEINGVADHVDAQLSDGFDSPSLRGKQFDLIFANILAGPLIGLAPDIARALTANGRVILSGILTEQAEEVRAAFAAAGIETSAQEPLAGWTSLLGRLA